MRRPRLIHGLMVAVVLTGELAAETRPLTFADRVLAQEALERVRYSHQIGAARPFESAVPRALLERKVREYVEHTVALERHWDAPITADMLEREIERMVRRTRLPGRLRELFAALGDDPLLVQECLARPALVERLVRRFPPRGPEAWWRIERETELPEIDTVASARVVLLDPSGDLASPIVGGERFGDRNCPPDDTWDTTSANDAPAARSGHSAVWTGNVVVIWGGRDDQTPLGTGGRYDPAIDQWSPTSSSGAPDARRDHVAVWTGNEMIVWGGLGKDFLDTGGRYDPIADTWTPTSTVEVPEGRFLASGVWTGTQMIVWGGWTKGGGLPRTGGRYEPDTDVWLPMQMDGAPIPGRVSHSTVWTGEEMIVWGGRTLFPFDDPPTLRTGGRYHPGYNIWTPMSTSGAPAARREHTAVWTEDRMIVWGGTNGPVAAPDYLVTGGSYDPVSDSWMPTSTIGAPEGRLGHTAVWSGSESIVWGGANGAALDSGGRYDPADDSWVATSTTGAPSGRSYHSAVWVGSSMIVWGGEDEASLDSGGRYFLGNSIDDDGDGFSECDSDCNDLDPETFPGAPEVCDRRDNDCDGEVDEGAPVPGEVGDLSFADRQLLVWSQPSRGSGGMDIEYELISGSVSPESGVDFSSAICLQSSGATTFEDDRAIPGDASGYWYLVRTRNACVGSSWGTEDRDIAFPDDDGDGQTELCDFR